VDAAIQVSTARVSGWTRLDGSHKLILSAALHHPLTQAVLTCLRASAQESSEVRLAYLIFREQCIQITTAKMLRSHLGEHVAEVGRDGKVAALVELIIL